MLCARCRCPVASDSNDHICPDRLRHPSVLRLLSALRRCESLPPSVTCDLAEKLVQGAPPDMSDMSPGELDVLMGAIEVAFIWVNMPASERSVVDGILEHAGMPGLGAVA